MNTIKMLESATADQIDEIKSILGMDSEQPEAVALVEALANGNTVKDGDTDSVEVVGRMGTRGRNSVSVVIDGKRYKVKRLSSRHSERVAAKYASKPKGYAKRAKRTGSAPKGLPTDSRIGADREQRTHES